MKIIKIKDYYGCYQEVPVSDELYAEWIKMHNENQRNYRREIYHRSPVSLDLAESMLADQDYSEVSDDLIRREEIKELYDAISSLNPMHRHQVLMYMKAMSYSDIARADGKAVSSVSRSLKTAFKLLRAKIMEHEQD